MESAPPVGLVVVGGGIAGLSAAYYARKKFPELAITVLEAADRWGGKILTERIPLDDLFARSGNNPEDVFIVEGGPDTFLASKPWGVNLCQELGLGNRLQGTNPELKNTYVLHNRQLLPLPDGLALMVPTDVTSILKSKLLPWQAKLRMGLDLVLPSQANGHDESLGAFISRRLGRTAYENLIEPLMSGIYAGDGDTLSLQSTFPYLRDLESQYGSLAWGALQMRKRMRQTQPANNLAGSRSAFLTPTGGLAEIVTALVSTLQAGFVSLRSKAEVEQVTRTNGSGSTWQIKLRSGETLSAEGLILACPAPASGKLLSTVSPHLSQTLESIPYTSTATVSLAFQAQDLPRPLDGYGYVIPHKENRAALACTWTSTKFPHRAPHDFVLLRVFFGRAGQEQDFTNDPDELLHQAREEIRASLAIRAEPAFQRVFIWEKAMPQYNLGHPEKLNQIETALQRLPGLALAGNGYRGIGIPDCIHSGELAVEIISQALFETNPIQ